MKKSNYIIDTHTHLGCWPTLKECKNNLLFELKNYNIDFILISADQSEFHNDYKIQSFKKSLTTLLNFVKKSKNMGMLIWCRLNEETDFSYLDTFINKNRKYIYGLKFHPALSKKVLTTENIKPFIELARKYDLPILVHTAIDEYSYIDSVKNLALYYKDINFIAAHLELLSDHLYAIKIIKETPNLYGDSAWVDSKVLPLIKKEGIINKFMFGSDSPIDGKETLSNPLYQSYFNNEMKLNIKDYNKIMYQNALKIYQINIKDLSKNEN